VLEHAEAVIFLSTAQEFPMWVAWATIPQGWALAKQGEKNEGLARIQQGLALYQAIEGKLAQSWILALLAEIYGEARQPEEGLAVLAEALAAVHRTEEHLWEAELYRLKGTLTLQSQTSLGHVSDKSQTNREQVTTSQGKSQASLEAEEYFWTAIEIARKQQAKSLELRATTSLARLWQQQGKQHEAHKLLSDIYNWFTEGFDTKDLQEAKALLEELT
jgi:predicted ATPase